MTILRWQGSRSLARLAAKARRTEPDGRLWGSVAYAVDFGVGGLTRSSPQRSVQASEGKRFA